MSNVIAFPTKRSLSDVLLEIAEVGPTVWSPDTRHLDDDVIGEALDRLDELQAEARAMIEAATGCSWNQIAGASL